MWWKTAQSGDKVTCKDDSGTNRYLIMGKPEYGKTYTVMAMWPHPGNKNRIVVSLRELGDFGWYVERFKPAKSTKCGMDILNRIVREQTDKVEA